MKKFLWKIGGEAGFGIMTVGLSFSKIAARAGYHVFNYTEYPSLIRGGHNTYEVMISDEEVLTTKHDIDLLVALNKATFTLHKSRLTKSSIVIYDDQDFDFEDDFIKVKLPFKKMISESQAPQVMMNTIAQAASIAILGGDINTFYALIEKEFAKKGQKIVDFNKKFAALGYEHIKNNYSNIIKPILNQNNKQAAEKLVFSGNDAFSLGCAVADCRLFYAYPMTPTSNVLTVLAGWQSRTGMVVRHVEDEISVINSALGSSFAGVRSSVGTSGGGFALMVEALSYAGIAEIPIVVILGQRPGPATGMPTWTEQGDLLFAVHAGHGEFPKIVLSPGDVYEMVELTLKAFDYADIYQTPVIVISEKFLLESFKSLDRKKLEALINSYKPNRGKTISSHKGEKYLRYKVTDDGISDRLIPGQKGFFYQANSYEHLEDSHTTEDDKVRVQQVEKRNRKIQTYFKSHFPEPVVYGDLEKSKVVFVSWGSNKAPILEALNILRANKVSREVCYIHFTHMYPLDKSKLLPLFKKDKRYILVENNSQGQFGKLLQAETGIEIKEKLLKYDGRPIWTEEIVNYLKS